jgi:SAM-dependent methyltransferase
MIKKLYKKYISERSRIKIYHWKAQLTSWRHKGDAVKCNCCQKSFNAFLPFGNPPRLGALCPNCLSLERTRLLKFYLEDYFESHKNANVLHFAPEVALVKYLKANCHQYVSADISKHVAEVVVDITQMQFRAETFDLILCSHVLAHVKEEALAIDEMCRTLKTGGKAILLTTIFDTDQTTEDLTAITPQQKLERLGQEDIWRKHGRDFIQRLKRPGIVAQKLDYRSNMNDEKVKTFGLGMSSREVFYILEKK